MVDACCVHDLEFVGYQFTWNNGHRGDNSIQERLDRFIANGEWMAKWGNTHVTRLMSARSDHPPILLNLKIGQEDNDERKKECLFRFEKMLLCNPQCDHIIVVVCRDANVWQILLIE